MKIISAFFILVLSLSSFAGTGTKAISIVLEQSEVEKLEDDMVKKGFTLSNIQDVYATRGVYPRCPCTNLDLTFSRPQAGKTEQKVFRVLAQGFGTSLDVTITPSK